MQHTLVIADLVKFYILQLEQYCRIHKYYISCLIYGTGLQISHCNHCREYPQSCSGILMAQESVLPHHPAVSSTESYLKQSAYIMDICSLLSTFLHNTFYVKDVHMARHEQQHGMCECPPNILDNSAWKHFQYTCAFLGDSQLGISYISNSGKSLPLDQSNSTVFTMILFLVFVKEMAYTAIIFPKQCATFFASLLGVLNFFTVYALHFLYFKAIQLMIFVAIMTQPTSIKFITARCLMPRGKKRYKKRLSL